MENWDGLDIDTSDLAAFVQRCNTNTSTHLISGPADNFQVVILNQNSTQPQDTQQFMNEIVDATHQRDFTSNPWRWAEQFIQFQGEENLILNAKILRCFYIIPEPLRLSIGLLAKHKMDALSTLRSLKSTRVLSLITCIVKACEPNGLGDMTITIKVRG